MTHTARLPDHEQPAERAGQLEARVLTRVAYLRPGGRHAEVTIGRVGPDGDLEVAPPIWEAVTDVPVEGTSADDDAALDAAEDLLRAAGWILYEDWYQVDSGDAIEVGRPAA